MLQLLIALSAAQVPAPNPADYPKVVHRDGQVCMQALNNGAVEEVCRPEGATWRDAGPTKVIGGEPTDAPRRAADVPQGPRLVPSSTPLLDRGVADALSSAMTKRAWSAPLILAGAGSIASGLLLLAGASSDSRGQNPFAVPGALTAIGGVVFLLAGIALHVSATSDIESVTAGGTTPHHDPPVQYE